MVNYVSVRTGINMRVYRATCLKMKDFKIQYSRNYINKSFENSRNYRLLIIFKSCSNKVKSTDNLYGSYTIYWSDPARSDLHTYIYTVRSNKMHVCRVSSK